MEKAQLKLRIPADVREWIAAKAEMNDRSINYMVTKMLVEKKQQEQVQEPQKGN